MLILKRIKNGLISRHNTKKNGLWLIQFKDDIIGFSLVYAYKRKIMWNDVFSAAYKYTPLFLRIPLARMGIQYMVILQDGFKLKVVFIAKMPWKR